MIPVTLVVIAKAPVAGFAKTRLAATVGEAAAADIAAASLLDTLDAVDATPVEARVVALTGNLSDASGRRQISHVSKTCTVVEQRGDRLLGDGWRTRSSTPRRRQVPVQSC